MVINTVIITINKKDLLRDGKRHTVCDVVSLVFQSGGGAAYPVPGGTPILGWGTSPARTGSTPRQDLGQDFGHD